MLKSLYRRVFSTTHTYDFVSPYPQVELFHWQMKDGRRNFGDHLSKIIVQAILSKRSFSLEDEVSEAARLLAIGSILHFSRDCDVIWGSGVNGKISSDALVARALDVRAVRGPKTAAMLKARGIAVPPVYGDPALLLPRLFPQRFQATAVRDYVIVPNLHDLELIKDDERLVSPLSGWNRCVSAITSARFVVASSLHGIIIAEAFGIPARYVRLSDTEDMFKYDDYAQGTGRATLRPATSIEAALDMGSHEPIQFDADALSDAFPYDLWTV